MKNAIVLCDCGMENFYDIHKLQKGIKNKCWACRQPLEPASRIKIGDQVVVLNLSTKLYGHHLVNREKYRFKKILAEVVPHPKYKDTMGLKNLSHEAWDVKTKVGKNYTIEFGKSFTIEDGTIVYFGQVEGIIRKG